MTVLAASHNEHAETDKLSALVFDVLGAQNREERESSNYDEGCYFRAFVDQVEIKISKNSDYDDLPFWLAFVGDDQLVEAMVLQVVKPLQAAGVRLARFEKFGGIDEVRIDL